MNDFAVVVLACIGLMVLMGVIALCMRYLSSEQYFFKNLTYKFQCRQKTPVAPNQMLSIQDAVHLPGNIPQRLQDFFQKNLRMQEVCGETYSVLIVLFFEPKEFTATRKAVRFGYTYPVKHLGVYQVLVYANGTELFKTTEYVVTDQPGSKERALSELTKDFSAALLDRYQYIATTKK